MYENRSYTNLPGCRRKKEQTETHRWASVRHAFCLRDALIHIILGGDKGAYAEVTAASLTLPMDRLSLTAMSYHTSNAQGTFSLFFCWRRLHSDTQDLSDRTSTQGNMQG